MRRMLIIVLAVWSLPLLSDPAVAQDPEKQYFTLKLTEIRPTESMLETGTSPVKIIGLFRQLEETQQLDVIQTVRISANEDNRSSIHFGSQPKSGNRADDSPPPEGSLVMRTDVQYRFVTEDERILVEVDFRSTRYQQSDPNRVTEVNLTTTIYVQPGQPTFVGGGQGPDPSFLIATLEPF